VDCSWSKDAANLRKIAIETPESLKDPNFLLKHFTTLRIVDKNVIIQLFILKFLQSWLDKFHAQYSKLEKRENVKGGLEIYPDPKS
jgi:hypothetical protein